MKEFLFKYRFWIGITVLVLIVLFMIYLSNKQNATTEAAVSDAQAKLAVLQKALATATSNAVLASCNGVTITNASYDQDVKTAIDIFNKLQSAVGTSDSATSKISLSDITSMLSGYISKYPQFISYITKLFGLSNAQRISLISKGISVANDKTQRAAISQAAITKNQPVWVAIVDKTFNGV